MSNTAILFILSYLCGLAACTLIDIAFGVYLYQFEYFINPVARWWYGSLPNFRYTLIIAIWILFLYILRSNRYSQNKLLWLPQVKWIVCFTIIMFLVGFIAVWPEMHWKTFIEHIKILVFIVIAYKIIDTPAKFEGMIWTFLLGNFYIGCVAHMTGRNDVDRLEGIGPADGTESNNTGGILIMAVPILIFYILYGKKWQKVSAIIMMAFVMDGIILVNSRGAIIGLAVAIVYMFVLMLIKANLNFKRKLVICGGALVCIALFFHLTDDTFRTRMMTIENIRTSSSFGLEGGGASRVYFWMKALDLAREHPFGVGVWGYQYLSSQFLPKEMLSGGRRAEHSTYFEAIAEYGYFGFLIFMGFVLSNFRFIHKIRKSTLIRDNGYLYFQSLALSASFLACMTANIFINRLYGEVMYWFSMFFACFANIYIHRASRTFIPGEFERRRQLATAQPLLTPAPSSSPPHMPKVDP